MDIISFYFLNGHKIEWTVWFKRESVSYFMDMVYIYP